jgi:hypothetical protein
VRSTLAAVLAGLVLAGAAAGADKPVGYIDKADGFRVVLPAKWYPVPRSATEVKQLIATLKKAKKTSLATAYGFYLTANGQTERKAYVFEAFYFDGPTSDPVPLSVSIQIVPAKRAYTAADLKAAGRTYASALASTKGAKVSAPAQVKLPAGTAELVRGVIPNGNGVSTGAELYLLAHGKRVYALSFKVNAELLSRAKVFRAIANTFRFA